MSKRLPYYQSEPAEYLAGDIMFCSYGAQGVFTIIRALYWQKDCSLTLEQAKRRISNADAFFNELINEKIIKINGENINITFLDNQFNDASKKSTTNSSNGKKGAEARWGKNSESIATPLIRHSETDGESIALREDKIKEDKIKEEKIKENNNYKIFNELIISESWIENTSMQSKAKFIPAEVKKHLKNYNDMINVQFDVKNNKTEYCTHFVNWLNKQEKKTGAKKPSLL